MGRSPTARLSPAEMASLRQLALEPPPAIPQRHGVLFLSMGFAMTVAGRLQITEAGRDRLESAAPSQRDS